MDVLDSVRAAVEPVLPSLGVELVDLEVVGSGPARLVRVYVDRDEGVDLETIARCSQAISAELDAEDPIPGSYTLEVSSPGLERRLRTPAHFRRVVGETVSVKTHRDIEGGRRHTGELVAVDDEGFTLVVDGSERRLHFEDVTTARTVFEWGPAPKPGKTPKKNKTTKKKQKTSR